MRRWGRLQNTTVRHELKIFSWFSSILSFTRPRSGGIPLCQRSFWLHNHEHATARIIQLAVLAARDTETEKSGERERAFDVIFRFRSFRLDHAVSACALRRIREAFRERHVWCRLFVNKLMTTSSWTYGLAIALENHKRKAKEKKTLLAFRRQKQVSTFIHSLSKHLRRTEF